MTGTPETPLRNAILNLLRPDVPFSEGNIRAEVERGCLRRYELVDVERTINELQGENKIRWVAFSGWCRGGRPS